MQNLAKEKGNIKVSRMKTFKQFRPAFLFKMEVHKAVGPIVKNK